MRFTILVINDGFPSIVTMCDDHDHDARNRAMSISRRAKQSVFLLDTRLMTTEEIKWG